MEYTRELFMEKSNQTKANRGLSRSWPFHIILNRKVEPVNHGYAEQAFSNQYNKGIPLGGLDQNGKKWSQAWIYNKPDLSVRTSVVKHSLRFNTSIMKKSIITHIFETTCGYHEAGPCT